jgi:nitrogen fixation protein NifX
MSMRRLSLVPSPEAEAEVQGPSVRVALATQDGRTMNAHFGSAKRFVVYDVSASGVRLVETISFEAVSDESGEHTKEGDDKNGMKIKALSGTELLVVQAIGGPVAARVIKAQIHPIKFSNPEPVDQIIGKVQDMLRGDTPPWLRKILLRKTERSMDFLDGDDD